MKNKINIVKKKLRHWVKGGNEILGIIFLIWVIWYVIPPVIRNVIDPGAQEFGVEILYVPLIAVLYCLIGLLFIWYVLWTNFPKARKLLDDLFEMEKLTLWQKVQFLSRLLLCLSLMFSVALLSVTGISFVM